MPIANNEKKSIKKSNEITFPNAVNPLSGNSLYNNPDYAQNIADSMPNR